MNNLNNSKISGINDNAAISSQSSKIGYCNENKIMWNAIIAGVIISLSCEIILNFLGSGLGITINPVDIKTFKVLSGVTVWLVFSGIVAMSIGGWFVGKFSGISCKIKRGHHGFVAWGLATMLSVMMTASATGIFMAGILTGMSKNQNMTAQISQMAPSSSENYSYKSGASGVTEQAAPSNEEMQDYAKGLGAVSLALFLGFFISAIASVVAARCATPYTNDDSQI